MPAHRMMQPAFDYDTLTGEIQHTLAAIADVEFAFQSACERLDISPASQADKAQILAHLEQSRWESRGFLEKRLVDLYEQARQLVGGAVEREHAPAETRRAYRAVALAVH